jgi:PAS domain S-box-containing protein
MGGYILIREQQSHSETNYPFCRARILYMEDDIGLGSLLQKRLEHLACMVEVARDGQEGLKMFANNTYDVVIADYDMPLVNGLEVLKNLKEVAPVIILTGQGDEKVAVEAMKLGAADYMIKDVNGGYLEILPSVIDRVLEKKQLIKDRQQARAQLQASEAYYRAIVEDQTEMICRCEPGGNLTFANEAFCRYFDIRQSDIVFQGLATILPRKVYQHIKGIVKALTPQNPSVMNAHDIKMLDGKVHWIQWTNRAIFVNSGKLKEYQMVGRDITELKEVEKALRDSEEKNSILLSIIPDTILRIDRHGTFVGLRSKKGQGLSVPPDFVGKNIAEFFSPDITILMMEHINKIFMEGTNQIFQFNFKQGESVSHQEARLVFAGGNEVLAILRDITERNKMEQKLQ